MGKLTDWLGVEGAVLWWAGALSVVMFIGTLILVPLFVARIPPDYFTRRRHSAVAASRHPLLLGLEIIVRNLIGAVLVLAGIAMLVLPGQGVITILIGLTLVDFPGKFRLQRRLVRQASVFNALNWMRRKAGRPALYKP